jgi:hypothetical protein
VLAALLPLTAAAALLRSSGAGAVRALEPPLPLDELYAYGARGPRRSPLRRAAANIAEEIAVGVRGLYLTLLFSPMVLSAPLVFYVGVGRERWMRLVRWTLERAGPAFIKWGAPRFSGAAALLAPPLPHSRPPLLAGRPAARLRPLRRLLVSACYCSAARLPPSAHRRGRPTSS